MDSTTAGTTPDLVHLRRNGVSLVLSTGAGRLPRIVHWGADLGETDEAVLQSIARAAKPPIGHNLNDQVHDISILPEFEAGWLGRPGVEGSRHGTAWSPEFRVVTQSLLLDSTMDDGYRGDLLRVEASDPVAGLDLTVETALLESGLLRARATIANRFEQQPYTVGALRIVFPVPAVAGELLDFTGRHIMERVPQRSEFTIGTHSREMRGGRTGLDAAYLLIAGESGFGFRSGEVWGTHVAFSGNQALYGERIYNGARVLGGGELLQHSEIVLDGGEKYESPWFYGSYGVGLDALSGRFHQHLRSRAGHPRSPRPVVINTWEAVYFEHDLATLSELADRAAAIGVERFVLDDGWFGSRRDDTSGLGDWSVSREVWPEGLGPLIDHVTGAGLDFGLWVEPEMINLDSDLARAHPEWIFSAGGRTGSSSRFQHVLDLTHPGAYDHILGALDALLDEYDIAYLKWDHNRLLVEAGHTPGGEPAIHDQTLAVYRMMDELKARHPGLEIESCASGGGRIDLGIIEHTDRVWGSDCNDPLERQQIHRYTKLLVPPELIGAHIGSSPSHTTGRTQSMQFRAFVAAWCHLGIEIDLRTLAEDELTGATEWIAFYREHRELLHSGTVVNADHPDESIWVNGVVAADGSEALFGVAAMTRSTAWPPGLLRLPGLDPDRRYRVSVVPPFAASAGHGPSPDWIEEPIVLSGRALENAGVQIVPLWPEDAYLLHVVAV
ncbi:alpha-galactosidase [Compostimonas suwonensis]|uniref:Alpha-galactosidase n=2 Tax=Compostimonas suwonensis TaxID=1048394 RepID=A0A2M9BWG9_9MICO|nr:alpha-galactosidase [Compostimonas suwonensis]